MHHKKAFSPNWTISLAPLILLAAMLLMASLLVRQERDSGMFNVVRSTPGGRMKTTAAKLAALAASMLAVLLLMYSVNLASLMRANELLGSYCDLYWFDTPVGLPLVEWLSVLVYDVLLIGGFCLLFCHGRLPAAQPFAGFSRKAAKTKPTTIFRQETRKLYLLGGALAVLMAFAGYRVWTIIRTESYINVKGICYAHYMKQLEGRYTKQTYEKLQTMQQRFAPIFELQKKLQRGELTPAAYEMQMGAYYGLQEKMNVFQNIVYGNLGYIKENPKAHFLMGFS